MYVRHLPFTYSNDTPLPLYSLHSLISALMYIELLHCVCVFILILRAFHCIFLFQFSFVYFFSIDSFCVCSINIPPPTRLWFWFAVVGYFASKCRRNPSSHMILCLTPKVCLHFFVHPLSLFFCYFELSGLYRHWSYFYSRITTRVSRADENRQRRARCHCSFVLSDTKSIVIFIAIPIFLFSKLNQHVDRLLLQAMGEAEQDESVPPAREMCPILQLWFDYVYNSNSYQIYKQHLCVQWHV
jgi:hypothetical protein